MEPQKVAAQFAAYVWCMDAQNKPPEEAARFARESWRAFIPVAHEGFGRLLMRVAALDEKPEKTTTTKRAAHRLMKGRKRTAVGV
jgi:hypothetical protein